MKMISIGTVFLGLQLWCGVGCSSTTENKARDVEREQAEVNEALRTHKSQEEVVDEMADADSAREEFREAWVQERNNVRDQVNAVIEEIDRKLAEYKQAIRAGYTAEKNPYERAIVDLKGHRTRMTNLLLAVDETSAADWQRLKIEAESLIEYTNYKVDRISVD